MEITSPVAYVAPVFILLMIVECILSYKYDRHLYEWKDFTASFTVAVGAGAFGLVTKSLNLFTYYLVYEGLKEWRLEWLGYESLGWAWWVWVLAILVEDFTFYWHHRVNHTVRILWASHVVHHSSEKYNLGTAVRNGWFILFYKWMFWIWMPALGFHPIMVLFTNSISVIYQFFMHSQFVPRLGFLEKIISTPTLHQVHHARNVEYLDKNHGGIFIFWDKLFGTYQDSLPDVKPEFGVLSPPNSYNPLVIITHEYSNLIRDVKKAKSWKDKAKYLLYAPGWSPDRSTKTAKELQAELKQMKQRKAQPAPEPALKNAVPDSGLSVKKHE